ncbi:hypothetical protein [Luteococcus peritonei]|uniref:DUF2868 domain-containing protein n=1 Tax=Luteococcus peritonei TaxID=88874 RepID=A0ABW4RZ68_9ACTN
MTSTAIRGGLVATVDPRARAVMQVLGPEVQLLLGTREAELFARRLLRLRVDLTDDEDREALQERIDALVPRVSWREGLARLSLLACGALGLAAVLWLVASHLLNQLAPHTLSLLGLGDRAWLRWPVDGWLALRVTLLLLLAVLTGQLALWLRAREALATARVGLREAVRTDPDVWPGVPVDSPFAARARLWGHPGTAALLLAAGLLGWQLGGHESSPALLLLALLVGCAGAGGLVMAHRIRRVDELCSRALFVGRV